MNYFVEGLQGSGKSTLVQKLSQLNPGYTAVREGEYSPVELSWCAYVDAGQYDRILETYPDLRSQIEEAQGDLDRYTASAEALKKLIDEREAAWRLARDNYTKERIGIIEASMDSLFNNDKIRKTKLTDFF